ncbi:MAG: HAD family hydrolase [Gemmatimonadaceae bacterium]
MPPKRFLDAVILDVDGTLYDAARMRRVFAPWLAGQLVRSPIATTRALRVVRAYRHAHESLRGERHADLALAQLTRAAATLAVAPGELAPVISAWFERAPLPAVGRAARPGLRSALERLRAAGLRLAVLSDYPPEGKLEALGITSLIDVIQCAQHPSVGTLKPDPTGLLGVMRQLGVEASRTVYVGDRPELDEAVAAAAGCRAAIIGARTPASPQTSRFRDFATLADWCLAVRG